MIFQSLCIARAYDRRRYECTPDTRAEHLHDRVAVCVLVSLHCTYYKLFHSIAVGVNFGHIGIDTDPETTRVPPYIPPERVQQPTVVS